MDVIQKRVPHYANIHKWVRNNKPKIDHCEMCLMNKEISELQVANISHTYQKDINDYKWLCVRCHTIFDKRYNNLGNYLLGRCGDENIQWKGGEKIYTCDMCGDEFSRPPSHMRSKSGIFCCSIKCGNKYKTSLLIRDNKGRYCYGVK